MKSPNDSLILAQPTILLALEDDTTVEAFSVLACLTEIELLVKSTWEPNIRFDLQANPGLPMAICSRMGLQSAIMNLLLNARDAMAEGGVIKLVAAAIYEGQIATEIELRVSDDGFGMTTDTLLRAIDPFFTTKTTGLGGLGLPIVTSFAREEEDASTSKANQASARSLLWGCQLPGGRRSASLLRRSSLVTIAFQVATSLRYLAAASVHKYLLAMNNYMPKQNASRCQSIEDTIVQ